MKRVLTILSLIIIIVLAAAELYVQSDTFANRIRPYILAPLRNALGPDAEIGWIKANLIPPFLEVRDISLPDAYGRQAIAIRRVRGYLNPVPLIVKKLRLPLISILEPRVVAVRSRDGELNLVRLIEQIKSSLARQGAGSEQFQLLLKTVTITKGRFTFQDEITSARITATGVNAGAKIPVSGDRMKFTIRNSDLRISAAAYPEFSGTMKAAVGYEQGRVNVDSFDFSTADLRLAATGAAGPFPDGVMDLKVTCRVGAQTLGRFTDLLKPAKKKKGPLIDAAVAVKGRISAPRIEGGITITGFTFRGIEVRDAGLTFGYKDRSVTINGEKWKLSRGDREAVIDRIGAALSYRDLGLDVQEVELVAADLALHLSGRADSSTGYNAVLELESSGKGRTLSVLSGVPLEGRIDVKGSLAGALTAPLFDGTISAGPLAVRGVVFNSADGRIDYSEKKLRLQAVDIRQRNSRYLAEGSIDFGTQDLLYSARVHVVRSDVVSLVALFTEPIPLQLTAKGDLSFSGTSRDFTGSGRLTFDEGSAYGESFTAGSVAAELSSDRISFPKVRVVKGGGIVEATGWIGFDGTYSAHLESRDVRLSEINRLPGTPFDGRARLTVDSDGSFSRPHLTASLELEDCLLNRIPVGSVSAGADIGDGLLAVTAELPQEQASVKMRLALKKPHGWSAQATVRTDGIDPFTLVGNKELLGRVSLAADGVLNMRGEGLNVARMDGNAVFTKLSVAVGDYRIENDGESAIELNQGKLAVSSLRFAGPGTRFAVLGGARLMTDVDLTVTGDINLSLFRLLYREVEHGDGVAEVKLFVKDEWNNPDISGALQVKNGDIKIKDIPQRFTGLNGKVLFEQGLIVADSLTGEMGGGALAMSGWVQLTGLALKNFSAKTSFENVTVRYPEGLVSTLSGDLFYDGDVSEQSLSGDVRINRARYEKRVEWKTMLFDVSKGFTQKRKSDVGWIGNTLINVRFHGANDIIFENNLAKMPLAIDIILRGTVNQPQLLGRIEANKGSVYFRNNEFKILHASADFIDPNRVNPTIDIQAEIKIREYEIRLAVAGTGDHAVVTLLSDPSLPDADILTLLALGKTSTELKGKENAVGAGEAYAFATGSLQDVIEGRTRGLTGLDRFQIDPYVSKTDTSVPRVTAGKELVQNKLYVTYSANVGAATPEQVFRIEYILNRHFSLVGERDEIGNTGADIKYRFEFK